MTLRNRVFLRTYGLLAMLTVAICATMSVSFVLHQRNVHRQDGELTARFLAANAAKLILWDDRVGLRSLLEEAKKSDPVICYAFVEVGRRPYVHTMGDGVPRDLLGLHGDLRGAAVVNVQDNDGAVIYDVGASVPQSDAIMHLGLSRTAIDALSRGSLLGILVICVTMLAVSPLLAVWVASRVTWEVDAMTGELLLDESRMAALLHLNQMTSSPVPEIATFALEEAVRLTKSTIGYVAFLNDDESEMTIHAWSKAAMRECAIVDKPFTYSVTKSGLWGEAVRQRKPVITNDYAAPNPLKKGCPRGHVAIVRHMNVPVFEGEKIVVVAGVGNKAGDYDESDVRQLTLFMQGMWQLIQRRKAADDLRKARDDLETRVRERTAELDVANRDLTARTEDLRVAAQTAEAANRAKGEFLANMSHEIRTPMTAILGFADILLERPIDREALEAAQIIQRNGEHLLHVINDILDLSKIEAGRHSVDMSVCSPRRILADVMATMKVRADAKGLPLELEYVGEIPEFVRTDPIRLRQILVNIVGNAIKFTEVGSVRAVVRCETGSAGATMLRFDVIDTGIGLTEQELGLLFQPFSQTDSSAHRRFGGTGLGLAISRRLARILGGDITVASVPGQGSTFRITITTGPLQGLQVEGSPSRVAEPPSPTGTAARRLDCRVLLAEDGPDNQRLMAFVLRKAGAEVVVVENGRMALDRALAAGREDKPFDVVLMDMQMPVMDGYEAARRLRAAGYGKPIIAVTAHAMAEDRQRCLDAGCDEYVSKPIDREQLIGVLEACVVKQRRSASPASVAQQ